MPNTLRHQIQQNSLSQQIFSAKLHMTHGDVMQVKNASRSERSASEQPAHSSIDERTDDLLRKSTRSQKQHVHSHSFVPLMLHVPCVARDEIERRAINNGKPKPDSLSYVARPIF